MAIKYKKISIEQSKKFMISIKNQLFDILFVKITIIIHKLNEINKRCKNGPHNTLYLNILANLQRIIIST